MRENDLPEGVIDADPPGGWESGEVADGTTDDQNSDAQGSPRLSESNEPLTAPDGVDPTEGTVAEAASPAGPVEREAVRGADPDLLQDADLEQGRAADPALDGGVS